MSTRGDPSYPSLDLATPDVPQVTEYDAPRRCMTHMATAMLAQPAPTRRTVPADWVQVTDAQRAELAKVAEYRAWMGVRIESRGTVSQIWTDERMNPWLMAQLNDELLVKEVRAMIAVRTGVGGGCKGQRYYRSFDTDYDCNGCCDCNQGVRVAAAVAAFIHGMGTLFERDHLSHCVGGIDGLVQIGRAVEAALGLGRGVARGLRNFADAWNKPQKGAWYRVLARQRGNQAGNAPAGTIGECDWLTHEAGPGRTGTPKARLGLRVSWDSQGLANRKAERIYINSTAVERVLPPTDLVAAKLAEIERKQLALEVAQVIPSFQGKVSKKAGDIGCIVAGPHKGKSGAVVWMGADKYNPGELRVGVRIFVPSVVVNWKGANHAQLDETEVAQVLWCSAREVIAPAHRVTSDLNVDVIERMFSLLNDAGFEAESLAYGEVFRVRDGILRERIDPNAPTVKTPEPRRGPDGGAIKRKRTPKMIECKTCIGQGRISRDIAEALDPEDAQNGHSRCLDCHGSGQVPAPKRKRARARATGTATGAGGVSVGRTTLSLAIPVALVPGRPCYVDQNGHVTQQAPRTGMVQLIGIALDATTVQLDSGGLANLSTPIDRTAVEMEDA